MNIVTMTIEFIFGLLLISLLIIAFSPLIVEAFLLFGCAVAAFVHPIISLFYRLRRRGCGEHMPEGLLRRGRRQSPEQSKRDSKIQGSQNSYDVQKSLESDRGQQQ